MALSLDQIDDLQSSNKNVVMDLLSPMHKGICEILNTMKLPELACLV